MSKAESESGHGPTRGGAALAAFLASGIGAFTMGAVVLANEAGLFVAPSLYAPAGGVSGRTTIAVVIWLASWGALHARWKDRDIDAGPVRTVTLVLIALGVISTFPPVWAFF
jgi:hypothetical protein